MLDHESQWLPRSAFITGSFGPLTALAMMVMEITEFQPYRISNFSHFYALSFCLVFIALTLPLYSLPTEYQISSFNHSFKKGFPTLYQGDSHCSRGEKSLQKPRSSSPPKPPDNSPRQPRKTKAEAWRLFCPGAGFTSSAVSKTAADSKPGLCYILSIDPQQQYTASLLVFMLKSISRKVSDLFRHPPPENILLLEVQETLMLFL